MKERISGKEEEEEQEGKFDQLKRKVLAPKYLLLLCVFSLFMMSPVSAADNETATMDLSSMTSLIDQVADLMPSFGDLAIAVVPILFIFIIIGFVTGLLDGLLDMIRSVLK
ncbi:hypothetical protein [Methanoplanus endosymbiosus]|uniref:Uncharacterized protein n=1 Tax=Methanoplanus endosymbiosus TaxID=33865 RepID=A0A9E7TH26_9EURY|nr:hypothetical protein [Methanoplanus endosymbiosus]UUX92082.1 hypothetical protein L6E24_12065 [Methanoplanus endosymbiosus]